MRRAVYAILLLSFIAEGDLMYAHLWSTPLHFPDVFLFQPSPVKLPLVFIIMLFMLAAQAGKSAAKRGRAEPVDRAIQIGFLTLLLWIIYGVARGGDTKQIPWQLFPWMSFAIFALLLISTMRTPKHIDGVFKVVVFAGFFRAMMGILFYVIIARNLPYENGPPAYVTTHDDSTLFVFTLVWLIVNALERRKLKSTLGALLGSLVMLVVIQLNNRRLAWVSLVGALIVVYFMLPKGKMSRKVNRTLFVLAPIIAIYVSVGWGRNERIFKPLKSLSTVTDKEDSSTRSRNAENAGLVVTMANAGWLVGTGWGHQYIEVDSTYRIDAFFAQWQYIPHNSVLGILAFSGALGFAGLWLVLPVSAFLNARTYRVARRPGDRIASLTGLTQVVIVTNQMYGDMGFQSRTSLYLMATGILVASRTSVITGAWPDRFAKRALRGSRQADPDPEAGFEPPEPEPRAG